MDNIGLCKLEIQKAEKMLKAAEDSFNSSDYDTSSNRAYYCVFHMICAVLILSGLSYSKHSAVIAKFRELYLKTAILDKNLSKIIDSTRDLRDISDYMVTESIEIDDAKEQIDNAKIFYGAVKNYIDKSLGV